MVLCQVVVYTNYKIVYLYIMIDYIRGELAELTPTYAVIEACGVGYQLFISLNTYTAIQNKKEAKLFAYEAIREDAHQLYGFSTQRERELFLLLLSVSGIGGQTARMVLSAFTTQELVNVISSGDDRTLRGVKGIGPKAAARIIVELKDKVATLGITGGTAASAEATPVEAQTSPICEEAVAALVMLGFSPAPTTKVVKAILKDNPAYRVEEVIKVALKML